MEPVKHWNLRTCAEQLAGFECEAGPIEMNDAYIWLKNAAVVGPEFLPGQGVYFEVTARAANVEMRQDVHFYIVGCHMNADTERRYWEYDLSYDPPRPWHYGEVHFRGVRGERLKMEASNA